MAVKTFYCLNTADASWGQLQDGGSAPAAAASAYGWTVAKTALGYWRGRVGATATATGTQAATWLGAASLAQGTGTTITTASNAFRSLNPINGSFANTTWGFSFGVRTGAASHAGRIRIQIWKGTNADGSGATKVGGIGIGAIATLAATATTYTTNGTVAAPGVITCSNEYLFFEVEWQGTTVGTSNSCTTLFYQGVCTFTTPDFTPANQTLTPSLYSEPADTFYTHAILGGPIDQTLTAALFTEPAETFATPIVQRGMVAGLYTNPQSFPQAARGSSNAIAPTPHANAQGFFDPTTVGVTVLLPPLTVNVSNFLVGDPYFFLPITVEFSLPAQALAPVTYFDPDGFFTHDVAAGTAGLAPALYDDPDNFPTHVLTQGGAPIILTPALYSDPDNLAFIHVVTPGGVVLFPAMYNDLPDTFFGAAMTGGIQAEVLFSRFHPFLENVGQLQDRT
jgi:hypothetical protein